MCIARPSLVSRFPLSSWFPHRFESEDQAIPWFCPKLRFLSSNWFPHRFESEDHAILWFCPILRIFFQVVGFPIGLSPRTIQYLGSVQNLDISLSSWFPHRFEFEDHTIPWFCPKLRYFFK